MALKLLRSAWWSICHPHQWWAACVDAYRFGFEVGQRYGFRAGLPLIKRRFR